MKKGLICLECKKKLNLKKENFVLISTTIHNEKKIYEHYFHVNCWKIYFEKCVLKKAEKNVNDMRIRVEKMIESNPMIKEILGNVKGYENLLSMFNMPLGTPLKQISAEEIKKKIENDRKKKRKNRKGK